MSGYPSTTTAPVLAGVRESHRAAGGDAAVTPLARLLKVHGIIADEVEHLTRRSAAAYLTGQTGREMVAADGTAEPLAGFLYANAAGGWILVNRGDRLARRRFSVAHELGHFVLHFQPKLGGVSGDERDLLVFDEALPPAEGDETGRGRVTVSLGGAETSEPEDIEDEADRFAATVLMPEQVCRTLIATFAPIYGRRRETLGRRLMSECLVSRAAMMRRLSELALP